MPEVLDPQLPNLPPEPDQDDPVAPLGYEPATEAERQQEIDDWDQQQAQPGVSDRLQDAGDTLDKGRGVIKRLQDRFGKKGLEGVEKKTVQQAAGRKLAARGAQEVAKSAGKAAVSTGAKAGVGAVTGAEAASGPVGWALLAATFLAGLGKRLWAKAKKNWPVALMIATIPFILLAIVFGLISGDTGPNIVPTTDAQKNQATIVAAISGDFVASNQLTQKVVNAEKERYAIVQRNVERTIPDRASAVKDEIQKITLLMEQAINLSGEKRAGVIKDVNEKVRTLDSTLPYGEWIAEEAEKYVGPNAIQGNFCEITGNNSPNLGCASVVSVIMNRAGAPQRLETSQYAIWRNPRLALIVDALPNHKLSRDLWTQSQGQLQRGDIVWWGNGVRKGKIVGLQSHIGVYIGNGKAVNNSSGKSVQAGIAVPVISDVGRTDITFNGAKRYGSKL